VLYVLARSASQGRRAGLVSVAGIHTGTTVHVLAAVLGLSAVLVASATAFTVVKLAGAAYLMQLGVRSLLAWRRAVRVDVESAADRPLTRAEPARSNRRLFTDAIVLNVLNPKTAVFFLAFVPQFVRVDAGNPTGQLLVLSAVFISLGLCTDSSFALAGSWLGGRLRTSPALARRKDLFTGTTYLGLGVVTAFSGGHRSS
jgi:threonine/homoserine/homoserine lactone efflux protein